MSEAAYNPFNFCVRLIKISISYLIPVVSAGFFVRFSWRGYSSPTRASIDCMFPCHENEVIKIELRKRNVWRYFRKFRTFGMQINFAIPPISCFRLWLGAFSPFSKVTNFLSLYQSTYCVISGHLTTVPTYKSVINLLLLLYQNCFGKQYLIL